MPLLSDEEIEQGLRDLDGWQRDGDVIQKQFHRGDFSGSVAFVNTLAAIAEELNHHPDLEVSWDTVTTRLSTHSEGGLTGRDFELAARIDALG